MAFVMAMNFLELTIEIYIQGNSYAYLCAYFREIFLVNQSLFVVLCFNQLDTA